MRSPCWLNRDLGALSGFHRLGGRRHCSSVLVEGGQAGWVADMGSFHPIQISFPRGAAYRREALGTDGVSGSVLVHTMGKVGVHEMDRKHLVGPQDVI